MSDNSEQIDYWNGAAGTTWVESQERMDRMLQPLSQAGLARAAATSGERCIDVGCGCGDTALALAASGADVWGIDISEPMLARATQRAQGAPGGALAFSQADAASAEFTPDHDLIFSRFGVMFFADPTAAFTNLRTALKPGGRLCFICWQAPRNNPWMSTAGAAIQPHLPQPATPLDPRAPGPFAFADRDYLHGILHNAGYSDIQIDPVVRTMHLADTIEQAMEFQTRIGPLARALAELEGAQKDAAFSAARDALNAHMTPTGLDLDAAVWVVHAGAGA